MWIGKPKENLKEWIEAHAGTGSNVIVSKWKQDIWIENSEKIKIDVYDGPDILTVEEYIDYESYSPRYTPRHPPSPVHRDTSPTTSVNLSMSSSLQTLLSKSERLIDTFKLMETLNEESYSSSVTQTKS
jgi:hypothetical protein